MTKAIKLMQFLAFLWLSLTYNYNLLNTAISFTATM